MDSSGLGADERVLQDFGVRSVTYWRWAGLAASSPLVHARCPWSPPSLRRMRLSDRAAATRRPRAGRTVTRS